MIERAARRLVDLPNVSLSVNSGYDLAEFADESMDFCFSFIVFQHIPSRAVIENYLREATRVLRRGAVFKFQLQGFQGSDYVQGEKDTWLGETFSETEVRSVAARVGLEILQLSGAGTQYFWVTARRRP
jgi:ubiquinone/menaquinone biosynthesis C-methylase UbiE